MESDNSNLGGSAMVAVRARRQSLHGAEAKDASKDRAGATALFS